MGTTHADYFMGRSSAPARSAMMKSADYETNTGHVIIENAGRAAYRSAQRTRCAGPRPWPICMGKDPANAVHNAVVLEEIGSSMNMWTRQLSIDEQPVSCRRCWINTICVNTGRGLYDNNNAGIPGWRRKRFIRANDL